MTKVQSLLLQECLTLFIGALLEIYCFVNEVWLREFSVESHHIRQHGTANSVALRKSLNLSCLGTNYANTDTQHLVFRRLWVRISDLIHFLVFILNPLVLVI
jgi:hypothetical protein